MSLPNGTQIPYKIENNFEYKLNYIFSYGGDISRKMKLLKRQAEGKKRMKTIANIEIPRETFIKVLKR
jgi:translation elongation factor EF-4